MTNTTELTIVTANHLLGGHSVFLGTSGWTAESTRAHVAHDAEEAARLEAAARADEAANIVVGVYRVAVELDAEGAPEPIHYREKLRARARPSFWAGSPKLTRSCIPQPEVRAAEAHHVSL